MINCSSMDSRMFSKMMPPFSKRLIHGVYIISSAKIKPRRLPPQDRMCHFHDGLYGLFTSDWCFNLKRGFLLPLLWLTRCVFLLAAVGCPDFQPVPDAWVRRSESTAVVVCNNTRETWHFVCRDHYWVGELRNCTQREYHTHSPPKNQPNRIGSLQ